MSEETPYAQRVRLGLCVACGWRDAEPGHKRCQECLSKLRPYWRDRAREARGGRGNPKRCGACGDRGHNRAGCLRAMPAAGSPERALHVLREEVTALWSAVADGGDAGVMRGCLLRIAEAARVGAARLEVARRDHPGHDGND